MASSSKDPVPEKILNDVPAIFVSRTHFVDDELSAFEDTIDRAGGTLTYDILEAGIIISKVTKRTRLLFDLRAKGITIEEEAALHHEPVLPSSPPPALNRDDHQDKRQQVEIIEITDDTSTASELGADVPSEPETISASLDLPEPAVHERQPAGTDGTAEHNAPGLTPDDVVSVVRAEWLQASLDAGKALPLRSFEVLTGHRQQLATETRAFEQQPSGQFSSTIAAHERMQSAELSILQRAKEDAGARTLHPARTLKRKFQGSSTLPRSRDQPSWAPGHSAVRHAHLLHATTSEEDLGFSSDLPDPPDWVSKGIKYACQRVTLMGSPNEEFVDLLRKIKLARLLTSDEIGVRAYSTSIAALLAYPYKFTSPKEIMRLPGCDAKIANLFVEYANTGGIKAVQDIEADHDLTILRLFYNIWGVGGLTARELYFDRGWQDLDDLVEYHWKGLSRVQQIGVKYYEQFLEPIPRTEVEEIGRVIHRHAEKARDPNVQSTIVGGYRRGKTASGDVDIIVSHPDEDQTLDIITDIVASLEEEGWITHTLLLSTNNTKRDQQTLPFRSGDMHGGHGFDSLDKALVVWQDPDWPSKEADLAADSKAKNPNTHRRVDIIIAPWRTVGCAVLGWSGGTTFQRDVRRYVKHLYGWKFDSSGVRDRAHGEVLDLEGYHRYSGKIGQGRAKTMLEAEKRVFEGLKLEYREPTERCTD